MPFACGSENVGEGKVNMDNWLETIEKAIDCGFFYFLGPSAGLLVPPSYRRLDSGRHCSGHGSGGAEADRPQHGGAHTGQSAQRQLSHDDDRGEDLDLEARALESPKPLS